MTATSSEGSSFITCAETDGSAAVGVVPATATVRADSEVPATAQAPVTAAAPAAAAQVAATAQVPATAQPPVTAKAPAASEMHGKWEQQEEVHAHRGDGGWWSGTAARLGRRMNGMPGKTFWGYRR